MLIRDNEQRIHLPLSGEYVIAAVEEERRLLIGDSICFGRFIVEAESLSHAAEKRIKDIYIHTTVLNAPIINLSFCTHGPCHSYGAMNNVEQIILFQFC